MATIIGTYVIYIPFSVSSGLSAIIFYAIGDYYKTVKPNLNWRHWLVGMVCWAISLRYSSVFLVVPRTDFYIIDIIGASAATLLVYRLSDKICKMFPRFTLLHWIGRKTMYILCFHSIDVDLDLSKHLTNDMPVALVLLSWILLPLISTFLFVVVKNRLSRNLKT